MQQFERDYAALITKIINEGECRDTRNGLTKAIFGEQLKIVLNGRNFPVIQGRKMYPRGVLGELAAMLRRPYHIDVFKRWGCNYWDKWARADGSIAIDYGNTWFDFNGVDQIAELKTKLRHNPTDRRMIISGWKPGSVVDLPCCHLLYQFYVSSDKKLHMMWYQRSVDMMVGLPSDIVFAAAWLIAIANEFSMSPGTITMSLGDCHIYSSHMTSAMLYVSRVKADNIGAAPVYRYLPRPGKDFCEFDPEDILLGFYASHPRMYLELKA